MTATFISSPVLSTSVILEINAFFCHVMGFRAWGWVEAEGWCFYPFISVDARGR